MVPRLEGAVNSELTQCPINAIWEEPSGASRQLIDAPAGAIEAPGQDRHQQSNRRTQDERVIHEGLSDESFGANFRRYSCRIASFTVAR